MANEKKKPAALTPAQKRAQDLKVKALEAKAKAAKSKFKSSKLRDENTPMPLAKGEYRARVMRTALKGLGASGKEIMNNESYDNKDIADWNESMRPRTKADSAFPSTRSLQVEPIKYREVRPSRMPSATKPKAPAAKPKAPAKRK
jgi:hypothetical protein